MSLRYHLFDPAPCAFPPPRVTILPKLAPTMFGGGDMWPSGFTGRDAYFYTRGRYALCEAYRLAGIGTHGGLLAPAYHCRTMLDPAISLGAPVVLYSLNANLQPDLAVLEGIIVQRRAAAEAPFKALLVTHYFGMPQDMRGVSELCRRHGLALIEDCSHAYFGKADGAAIGTVGDYAVASPYKFFACEDGGLLVANRGAPMSAQRPRRPSIAAELRGMARALQTARACARQRVSSADIARLDSAIRECSIQPTKRAIETEAEQDGCSSLYQSDEEGKGGLVGSRLLMRGSDQAQLVARRRANYQAWVEGVRGLPHCRALFPHLPDACVPYMFPLYIERPEIHFYMLKQLGVPVWRWDEMAVSPCPVSADYRVHLIHLPCHQHLHDAELKWMVAAVSGVMRCTAGQGA